MSRSGLRALALLYHELTHPYGSAAAPLGRQGQGVSFQGHALLASSQTAGVMALNSPRAPSLLVGMRASPRDPQAQPLRSGMRNHCGSGPVASARELAST